jgi:hypothetical protein
MCAFSFARLLLFRSWCLVLCLTALAGCSTYFGLLGYPTPPRPRDFATYNPHFQQQYAQVLAHSNLSFAGCYYRVVPSGGYRYLKFRTDGSFFTAFLGMPPQQFTLLNPVDDLGYFSLVGDSAQYELKTAINHTGFTGTFHFYRDSLLMREQPLQRKDKPTRLVYRRYPLP